VENQTKGELAQLCGMPIRRFDRACEELIERGTLRRSQSRPYAPNRYEIVSLAASSGSSFLHNSNSTSSDSWGSGAVGSPQPPSIEGAGAPATLLPSNRRSVPANQETHSEFIPLDDPLRKLTMLRGLPANVWNLIHTRQTLADADIAYLAYRYLLNVEKVSLPEDDTEDWPLLSEFIDRRDLEQAGAYETLETEIRSNPRTIRDPSGDIVSLIDEELTILRRASVRTSMEEE